MSNPGIITINAYHPGTGKAQIIANIGALLARSGKKVCLIDKDIQLPRLHFIFDIDNSKAFNEFVNQKQPLLDLAQDVTTKYEEDISGKLYVIPARKKGVFDVAAPESYDIQSFNSGLDEFINSLQPDIILINPPVGADPYNMYAMALSTACFFVMRLDENDYEGTGILIDIAQRLNISETYIIINMVDESFNRQQVEDEVASTYQLPVTTAIPFSNTLLDMESHSGLFIKEHSDLAIVDHFKTIASKIESLLPPPE